MLEFIHALRSARGASLRVPPLVLAFLVAEFFYKFHSFALECGAFLLTWLVLDVVFDRLAAQLAPVRTPADAASGAGPRQGS